MDLTKICNWIKDNYDSLPKSNINGKELVIFSTGDFGGEYGYGSSDLESWGVDNEGKLFWAFASGCSCYCNTSIEEKTMKVFEVTDINNMIDATDICKKIVLFDSDIRLFKESITIHVYSDW